MIGDVNLFFTGPTDKSSAEIEVMIADDHYRGKGLGSEALKLMMIYAYDSLRCQSQTLTLISFFELSVSDVPYSRRKLVSTMELV